MQKTQKRWIASVLAAAKAETPALPFQRGYRRPTDKAPRKSSIRRVA